MPEEGLAGAVVEDPVEALVPLVAGAVDEFEELEELLGAVEALEGAVGRKLSFPEPKPTAAALLPPTVIAATSSLPVMTRSPLLLSHAATFAWPETLALRALIKLPTVSLPVDVYFVVKVPSLTVTVPPARIPRLNSEAVDTSGTVPVPIAGAPSETGGLEDPDELEEVELLDVCSAACAAAASWELTRVRAVWLAMLAMPDDKFVIASAITLMRAVLSDWVWSFCCA